MVEKYYSEQSVDIYCGHVLDILKSLDDKSVQMCLTSPPYWGLRNYAGGADIVWGGDENCEHEWDSYTAELTHENRQGLGSKAVSPKVGIHGKKVGEASFCSLCSAWKGQLGLEPTPELYVEHLMMIFREVKRVLRKDGSFYLNIGDTYWGGKGQSGSRDPEFQQARYERGESLEHFYHQVAGSKLTRPQDHRHPIIQPKCMTCIPERVMFAMIEEGWILRNKIVWHKPNAMPSSVKDRFTTTWEYMYFFTKARKYYFDLDAVRVPHATQSLERYQRQINFDASGKTPDNKYIGEQVYPGSSQIYREGRNLAPNWFGEEFPPDMDYKGKFNDLFGHGPNPQSFNLRVRDVKRGKGGATAQSGELKASQKEVEEYEYPEKRISPSDIARKYGYDPEGICPVCGRTWKRHASPNAKDRKTGLRREFIPCVTLTKHDQAIGRTGNVTYPDPLHTKDYSPKGKNPGDIVEHTSVRHKAWMSTPGHPYTHKATGKPQNPGDYWELTTQPFKGAHFAVFPEKLCERPILASSRVGDVILDPMGGSGTVGVVAKRLGRKAIIIDCVEDYCIIAKDRISKVEYQPELQF